ncbi:hypothetical protein VPH35_034614 [Triticum aestivum]|uniref:Uncharacterized protein n=1 Tax=Aegilops tauschii subsp. strangulata TaxID=200361 RepID=A0A453AJJ8_AEGTS
MLASANATVGLGAVFLGFPSVLLLDHKKLSLNSFDDAKVGCRFFLSFNVCREISTAGCMYYYIMYQTPSLHFAVQKEGRAPALFAYLRKEMLCSKKGGSYFSVYFSLSAGVGLVVLKFALYCIVWPT